MSLKVYQLIFFCEGFFFFYSNAVVNGYFNYNQISHCSALLCSKCGVHIMSYIWLTSYEGRISERKINYIKAFYHYLCLSANWRFHTHSKTQMHAIGATSGASDYAVKANQLPVFGLMDAIIFMDLKQVSALHHHHHHLKPSRTHTCTHLGKCGP